MSTFDGSLETAWQTIGERRERLRLIFDWQDDRYQMQLLRDVESPVERETGAHLLLASVDGTPANRWPPSPPLQSGTIEERGEQLVALAVGMAGGAHWSASIETLAEPHALRFDCACRMTEQPEFLGSTFEIAENVAESALSVTDLLGAKQEVVERTLRIIADPPVVANSVLVARWQFTLRYVGAAT